MISQGEYTYLLLDQNDTLGQYAIYCIQNGKIISTYDLVNNYFPNLITASPQGVLVQRYAGKTYVSDYSTIIFTLISPAGQVIANASFDVPSQPLIYKNSGIWNQDSFYFVMADYHFTQIKSRIDMKLYHLDKSLSSLKTQFSTYLNQTYSSSIDVSVKENKGRISYYISTYNYKTHLYNQTSFVLQGNTLQFQQTLLTTANDSFIFYPIDNQRTYAYHAEVSNTSAHVAITFSEISSNQSIHWQTDYATLGLHGYPLDNSIVYWGGGTNTVYRTYFPILVLVDYNHNQMHMFRYNLTDSQYNFQTINGVSASGSSLFILESLSADHGYSNLLVLKIYAHALQSSLLLDGVNPVLQFNIPALLLFVLILFIQVVRSKRSDYHETETLDYPPHNK